MVWMCSLARGDTRTRSTSYEERASGTRSEAAAVPLDDSVPGVERASRAPGQLERTS